MPKGKRWTREELLLAMNLYCRLPFGKMDRRTAEVVQLAAVLDRTPSSVAMKLCNLASLDPAERKRGITGLTGASKTDKAIWQDFEDDWDTMMLRSEVLWQQRVAGREDSTGAQTEPQPQLQASDEVPEIPDLAETERAIERMGRRGQDLFRRTVLSAYDSKCCITENPVPDLLVAGHILPWSESRRERLNPRNGLCLSRLHEAAFDRGLFTLDSDLRVVISRELKDYLPNEALRGEFVRYEGEAIRSPEKFAPKSMFLEAHREQVFRG